MQDEITDFSTPPDSFVRSIDIRTLLPQREPFVMVGTLVHFDMQVVRTETTVDEQNIFVDNGKMSSSGLIENIAQTCAARIGYVNKYILKKGIQIGFIGAIRNLTVSALPSTCDVMTTEVTVIEEIFGMVLANAKVCLGQKELVTCEIKIAIRDEQDSEGENS